MHKIAMSGNVSPLTQQNAEQDIPKDLPFDMQLYSAHNHYDIKNESKINQRRRIIT